MKLKAKVPFNFLKHTLPFTLLFFNVPEIFAQPVSPKRGIAYGNNSPEDLTVLSQGVNWWYNWSESPEYSVLGSYQDVGMDFVPMAWNGNFNEQKLRDFLQAHPGVKYILGFNEPNFTGQANMTPTQAAANWPKIQAIADEFDLMIVGPAVNYCGNCVSEGGITYSDPIKYLDAFFTGCSNCRVDYIAFHSYMNTIGALSWYLDQFKKYGKPIWVTEFAGWESNNNINSAENQESFLIGAVDLLENDTDVFRYSWFTGRTSGGPATYPYIDLLDSDGELTPLGDIYMTMPIHDADTFIQVPARIEAENYSRMKGFLLEKTADVSGFANVGYTEEQDWLEYNIDVTQGGLYPVDFRIAATQSSGMDLFVDGIKILTQNFTNTGGWQSWQTFHNSIILQEGNHKLRLVANSSGFNINWIELGDILTGIPGTGKDGMIIYPNPAQDVIYLSGPGNAASVEIVDISGRVVLQAAMAPLINIAFLSDGYFMLNCISEKGDVVFRGSFIKGR